jgi:hypothetical protein
MKTGLKTELRNGSGFENCPTLIQEGIFNNFYIKFVLNKHIDHYYECMIINKGLCDIMCHKNDIICPLPPDPGWRVLYKIRVLGQGNR